MELDEFGALFNARLEQAQPTKSAQTLISQLQSRSQTALEKIIRNMLWEVIIAVVSLLAMTILLFRTDSYTARWMIVLIFIISLVQIIAFGWQYRQLKAMSQPVVTDLRNHLQRQITVVERFIRTYFAFCLWVVPVSFFMGGYIGYSVAARRIYDPLLLPLDRLTLSKPAFFILLVFLVAGLIGFLYLVKVYIQWLYGRYLDQLKTCLTELEP